MPATLHQKENVMRKLSIILIAAASISGSALAEVTCTTQRDNLSGTSKTHCTDGSTMTTTAPDFMGNTKTVITPALPCTRDYDGGVLGITMNGCDPGLPHQ
jgi:hypothetical protein